MICSARLYKLQPAFAGFFSSLFRALFAGIFVACKNSPLGEFFSALVSWCDFFDILNLRHIKRFMNVLRDLYDTRVKTKDFSTL